MAKFRVVIKIPATLYVYFDDVEAENYDALTTKLKDQKTIDDLLVLSDGSGVEEVIEVYENANWVVDEVGPASAKAKLRIKMSDKK
jgi:hypothetical protein